MCKLNAVCTAPRLVVALRDERHPRRARLLDSAHELVERRAPAAARAAAPAAGSRRLVDAEHDAEVPLLRVGVALWFHRVLLQSKHKLTTGSMIHILCSQQPTPGVCGQAYLRGAHPRNDLLQQLAQLRRVQPPAVVRVEVVEHVLQPLLLGVAVQVETCESKVLEPVFHIERLWRSL
jgi:hypothetical protein